MVGTCLSAHLTVYKDLGSSPWPLLQGSLSLTHLI